MPRPRRWQCPTRARPPGIRTGRRRTSDAARAIRHVPERMCLGCGRRAPKHDLVRFTAVPRGGALVVVRDRQGTLGGRGLYTCASRECVERALERRGFARGARARVMADAALVDELGDGEAVSG